MNKINCDRFLRIIKKVQLRALMNSFIIIIFAFSAGGCSAINYFNEPKGFNGYQSDSRIFYETGAEARAKIIAKHLNSIIEEIENKQYRPFTTKIRIYVFSDLDNYQKHSLANGSAGLLVIAILYYHLKRQIPLNVFQEFLLMNFHTSIYLAIPE